MTIQYTMIPDLKMVYVHASGSISGHDVLTQGAQMFAEQDWSNGFSILCDYREITQFDVNYEDVLRLVKQDKLNETLFDQSQVAILTGSDAMFGIARMWTTLSENTQIKTRIFQDLEESLEWMNVDHLTFQTIAGQS
jgi:hypothetical protein